MRVYNLGQAELIYKGRPIPPNGGSLEYPDLTFVPDRDRANKYLAFGSLPRGWKPVAPPPAPPPAAKKTAPAPVVAKAPELVAVETVPEPKADEEKVEAKESWKRKMK